ncbi:hypothetical protein KIW84_055653 [Lathyrus oleraceus]|uniref:Uncharacterized protein n=1 Tax=Pisum sativum TaxID=3888 RepID=A0A9D5ALL8_PEA|nr:hypothetical protein KIW84_055653 [Pisum sativum]
MVMGTEKLMMDDDSGTEDGVNDIEESMKEVVYMKVEEHIEGIYVCPDVRGPWLVAAVDNGDWKALKVGRHGPTVSHLMFVDDILLFGEASNKQIICVNKILNTFCNMSRQEVSQEKTIIFFSKNVSNNVQNQLVDISSFSATTYLGKYIGIPLTWKTQKKEDYCHIIDQVKSKLTSWKGNHLAFEGRVTLAKSVMEVMPIHPIMTNIIPKS